MLTDQPHPPFRHYCRICRKGFGCGRALGGHMRAHGINDDGADDPSAACFDVDKPPGHKRTYSLRTNPNRFKSSRVCENCGKEFLSWRSFLEHGRCTSDDDDAAAAAFDSSPDSAAAWFKGKRSRRSKPAAAAAASSEEEDLAKCLVMLSAARVDPILVVEAEAEAEESCASASKEEVDRRLIFFDPAADKPKSPAVVPRSGMFECKACKKVFGSHQALGGHRASHKKVKGCFAAKLDVHLDDPPPITLDDDMIVHEMSMAIVPFDNHPLAIPPIKKRSKVHECSICHRVFASGQALGGHKRCHWLTSNSPDPAAMPQKLHHHYHHQQQLALGPMAFDPSEPSLDLNLPAPGDDLRLDVPAAMYLQTWARKDKGTVSSKNDQATCRVNVEDEADSKVKLAKLSDLKDMGGESSAPWLQVGIGSSGNEGGDL